MRYKDWGAAVPKRLIYEFKVNHDILGTSAQERMFCVAFMYPLATYISALYFCSDGLFVYTGSYVEVGTDLVDLDVDTTWRVLVDQSNTASNGSAKAWIWKNGVLVASNISIGYTTTGATVGRQTIFQYSSTSGAGLSYLYYMRIYSEDGTLLQTVIE